MDVQSLYGAIENHLYKEVQIDLSQLIDGKVLRMDKIIEKFVQHLNDIFCDKGERFCEEEGRRYFMLYIKPIINGIDNYIIEAQTRELSRVGVIIDYLGTQYNIEMKI